MWLGYFVFYIRRTKFSFTRKLRIVCYTSRHFRTNHSLGISIVTECQSYADFFWWVCKTLSVSKSAWHNANLHAKKARRKISTAWSIVDVIHLHLWHSNSQITLNTAQWRDLLTHCHIERLRSITRPSIKSGACHSTQIKLVRRLQAWDSSRMK